MSCPSMSLQNDITIIIFTPGPIIIILSNLLLGFKLPILSCIIATIFPSSSLTTVLKAIDVFYK